MAEARDNITENTGRAPKTRFPLFTRLWFWFLDLPFSQIKFPDKSAELTASSLEKGVVIHIIQYYSFLEYLILNFFLRKSKLPPAHHPEESWVLAFFKRLVNPFRKKPPISGLRDKKLKVGDQYVLFLQKPGTFLTVWAEQKVDEIQRLLDIQNRNDVPIILIPHIFFWSKSPARMIRSLRDFFFGNSLQPGRLRKLIIFLLNFRSAFMRTGEPLALKEWASKKIDQNGRDAAKALRWKLFQFFTEERMAVTGPFTRPRTWILESVLNSTAVQEKIKQIAAEQGRAEKDVAKEAAKQLDFMAADYKFGFYQYGKPIVGQVISHLYNPIDYDHEGLERIRELLKQGPVVFVPSHKSHLDYITLPLFLYGNGIVSPHVIAGENLAFWPMGFIFRRFGAIFIRRSSKGDRLYNTLLRTYLSRMFWEGYSQEFFIEGGRSRTGKLLLPKFGILSFYVDTFLNNPARDIRFVPISFIYTKLIEEKSYQQENLGHEKSKESASSLLKVLDAIKLRYGALHMRVGEPISLADYAKERDIVPGESETTERQRHELIQELGYEIVYRINQVMTVTPSAVVALALLASSRKGVTQRKLLSVIEIILQHLHDLGTPMSAHLDNSMFAISETLEILKKDGSIHCHTIGNEIVYTINENQRRSLDYYKNYILHYFVPSSLLAISFLSFKSPRVSVEKVKERARFLADLLKLEIVFAPRSNLDGILNRTLIQLSEKKTLEMDGKGMLLATERTDRVLPFHKALLINLLESYWVVANSLHHLLGRRLSEKRFVKILMDEGKKMALIGDLEREEAYSKTNFKNAIQYFIERGVLIRMERAEDTSVTVYPPSAMDNPNSSGKQKKASKKRTQFLELAQAYSSPEAVKDVAHEIRFYLDKD